MMSRAWLNGLCLALRNLSQRKRAERTPRRRRALLTSAEACESRLLLSAVTPYLQNPAEDAMTVMWFTDTNTPGTLTVNFPNGSNQVFTSTPVLQASLAYASGEASTFRTNAPYMHRIRVTGLSADTTYNYSVSQGADVYSNHFRTLASGNSSVRFIVYGDTETNSDIVGQHVNWAQPFGDPNRVYPVEQDVAFRQNNDVIESRSPDFLGIAGDIADSGGAQRDWDELWRDVAGVNGDLGGSVPILGTPGNHDDYGGGAFGGYSDAASIRARNKFATYFESPDNGSSVPEYKDRFFRLDDGPITYISLDVGNGLPNGTSQDTNWLLGAGPNYPDFNPGSPQYQWLEAQLADAQANSRFTFVVFHHSPYSVGPHGFPAGNGGNAAGFDNQSGQPVRALTPLFLQYGVDAVISGHDEMYEHSVVDGLNFYDIGTAGDELRRPSSGPDGVTGLPSSNPFQVFLPHLDAPEVWNGKQLVSGGKHYGHMEVNVNFDPVTGTWKAQIDPVYNFPLMDANGNVIGWDRRIYNDSVTLTANAAPSNIALAPASVQENQPVGTTVGLLSSVDAAGDTHTYNLVAGDGDTDNGSFVIVNGEVRTNAIFNFQAKSSYSIRVQSVDQAGLSFAKILTISVTSAQPVTNHAPIGKSKVVSLYQDHPYTFLVTDFGFTDPNDTPSNSLLAVKITKLPEAGSLSNNGSAVTLNQSISATDILAGKLTYSPGPNARGVYANFSFRVQDNGGTSNGGVDTDPTSRSIVISVTPISHAPIGTSKTVQTLINTPYAFQATDFGFTDPNDSPANVLAGVIIAALPSVGTLKNNGLAVVANQFIRILDINSGKLIFTPAVAQTGVGYASVDFRVVDNGGTANGGANTDPNAKQLTIDVVGPSSPNNAPSGTSQSVTILEDKPYSIKTADFGFSDLNDTPNNSLFAVKISTLPSAGLLKLNGASVVPGQLVSATDISGGKLVFIPGLNGSSLGYSSFTFQVQDNGGTNNGGVDTDPVPKTMTFDVTNVNDAPVGTSKALGLFQDRTYALLVSDFGFTDPNDNPANSLLAVKITKLPEAGSLSNNGIAVTLNQSINVTDILGGKLTYTPGPNAKGYYASIAFRLQDNGGTVNGGIDTDLYSRTMAISVTPVNHAPIGTSKTIAMSSNTSYTLLTSDFGFTDPNDVPVNTLAGVMIATLPGAGTLKNNGIVVTVGQFIRVLDITGGKLIFTPAANATGVGYANFDFQVVDNGGTANGGLNTDQIAKRLTFDVN